MGTGCGEAAAQLCLALWSSPALVTHTQGSLAMAMVAGAVVLSRNTARTSVRAEAGGSVFLVLALLSRLAQDGATQGNLTKLTCETRPAEAEERPGKIKAAGSHGAGVTPTFIRFSLTAWPFKAWETLAVEGSRLVLAVPPIGTGGAAALVHVFLASGTSESRKAEAQEAVELVVTGSLVEAGVRGTLIGLHFTEPPFQAWWAEALEGGKQVQAGAARVTGLRQALIVVSLAAGARVARQAEAVEGARGVDAGAAVFTGTGSLLGHLTLIQILVAGGSRVARLAYAEGRPRQGVGAALGIHMARLPQTHVFQVAQEACASRWAEAGEGAHTVDAGGSQGTGGGRTVIQVLVTALASPATHTHTVKATSRVLAGATVSAARPTLGFTFIYVFGAVPALPRLGAEAGVGAQPILAGGPVLTLVPDTVIWIHLTVQPCETWGTEAEMKGSVSLWHQLAGASIETGSRKAGSLPELALGTFLPHRAEALEGAQGVVTGGAPRAGSGLQEAFIDVEFTDVTLEAGWTTTLDLGVCGQAHTSVGTGVG